MFSSGSPVQGRIIGQLIALSLISATAWAAISVDANVSKDTSTASTTIATPAFSTTSGNELLLAFVATDYLSGTNTTVTSITGAGLTWVLVSRTNVQHGSAEIWRSLAPAALSSVTVTATLSQKVVASITVMSFAGVDTSGTNGSGAIGAIASANATSGAPAATLVTTRANSEVIGVGNDYDNAIARTPGTGQSVVHQYPTPLGDTYWVQMQTSLTPLAGTTVSINDTAPTGDRYNLSICEILASPSGTTTWNISGTISPATAGSAATVTLSGAATATTTADANGNYSFAGLANGSYTTTPSKSGFSFTPTSQPVTINGASQTAINFAGQSTAAWSIAGTISPAAVGSGATVALSGAAAATTTADANGNYSFAGLANGSYTVTPSKSGFSFTPASQPVAINGASQTAINFAGQSTAVWSIAGTISPVAVGSGATVALSGAATASTKADANGNYSFTALANGSYTVTPSKSGFSFTPASQPVTINGASQTAVNFTGQSTAIWSIAGTLSPTAGGAGATVSLTGAASAAVTADASGNYSFGGLANGSYTVTPANTGYTFTPANRAVTVNGASQTGINFTAQASGQTWSISGTISPSNWGSGATLTLSGAASLTAVADASGNYTFSQLANGAYTITPSKSGYTFSPTNQTATVSGANLSAINFTAIAPSSSISVDANVSKDGTSASTTITSPSFSTSAGSELLLAFIATDYLGGANTTVQSVSGAGLTWVLVVRTNGQSGSAEIWRAFAANPIATASVTATLSQSVIASLTVQSFSGVDTGGANGSGAIGATASKSAASGAPTASLITTRNNSVVIGVGNDYDNAVVRTLGAGQSLVHQDLTPTGDTYWVQRQTNPISSSGTSVTINDTAPTADRYNLSIVELLASTGGTVDTTPPTVAMTAPATGSTVSSIATVSATASDNTFVAGVQFLLDGSPLGAEITTTPYSIAWDTTQAANGSHTLSATATDSVGLTATATPVTVTVNNTGNASVVGSWSTPVSLPAVAVNLILLQNNKVLFYQDGATPTVWNYMQNTFTNIPAPADLFCSGHALLADGRILVAGGYGQNSNTIGIANAEIFDPTTNVWTTVPDMAYRRWYPTATTLPDGRILVTAGWQTTAHTNAGISEIYDPASNSWTQLTNANNPFETYPFLYVLSDGRVLHIGGSEYPTDTDVLNLTTNTWSVVDANIVDGASAIMYAPNKFMKAGSATDSQGVGPASNTTFVLDMTQPSPAWRQTASMSYPRSFLNLTSLPDGSVLATGGETDKNGGNIANAVYAAELWSPQTQTWSTMASMHTPREYHGTALLLPDGRVLVSGMGADFGQVPDEKSAEFYSPPYLFQGARPAISQSPAQAGYGSSFFVGTADAASIASVALIRTGAVTHFFDENARYVPLSFSQTTGGLTVTAPANANLAPPGFYMLFIVNSAGVPSIAPFIQLH